MRLRLMLATVLAVPVFVVPAGSAGAVECRPTDSPLDEVRCCEKNAEKVNGVSRKLTGQDLLLCPH